MDVFLTAQQLGVLAIVVSIVIWIVTFLWVTVLKQPKPKKEVIVAGVFVLSVVLAWFWTPLAFPVLPVFAGDIWVFVVEILNFLAGLLAVAVLVMKTAQKIYDWLISPILTGIDDKAFPGSPAGVLRPLS